MKKILLIMFPIVISLLVTGCTVQFKAKEIELEGHSNTTYRFTGLAWTEPEQTMHYPADEE